MTNDATVRSSLIPCISFRVSVQCAQYNTHHSRMGDYRERSLLSPFLKKTYFVQHSSFKVTKLLSAQRGQMGVLRNPAASISFVPPFNLLPAKSLPFAEADFTQ